MAEDKILVTGATGATGGGASDCLAGYARAIGDEVALIWNLLGLFALANVVTRSVLSAPGLLNFIHAETPNRMMGMFPYLFIPASFVPLAVVLHVVAMRAIGIALQQDR